jgi:hypothetical protein
MTSIRHYINLVEASQVSEKYSRDNISLRNYMKDEKFDPYGCWWEVCEWIFDNGYEEEVAETVGKSFEDADELREEEPEIFFQLPQDLQERIGKEVVEDLLQNNPSEAPSHAHMGLNSQKLLPRTTWLIHFTDHAEAIAEQGFTRGIDQMDKLGLTTYMGDGEKKYGGYNFAFQAGGGYARQAASQGKYGRDAVMFQNSGVAVHHYGDEEEQIIFHGTDVDPRDIVVLRKLEGDWHVIGHSSDRPLFTGEFRAAEAWVMKHFQQYRRALTRR